MQATIHTDHEARVEAHRSLAPGLILVEVGDVTFYVTRNQARQLHQQLAAIPGLIPDFDDDPDRTHDLAGEVIR